MKVYLLNEWRFTRKSYFEPTNSKLWGNRASNRAALSYLLVEVERYGMLRLAFPILPLGEWGVRRGVGKNGYAQVEVLGTRKEAWDVRRWITTQLCSAEHWRSRFEKYRDKQLCKEVRQNASTVHLVATESHSAYWKSAPRHLDKLRPQAPFKQ